MKHSQNWIKRLLMPVLLGLLVSGCATVSPSLPPPVVQPPAIPTLPMQARQPKSPPICLPTCSAGLTRLRMELLDSLTSPQPLAKPASAATTR